MKAQNTLETQSNSEKMNIAGAIPLSYFKLYYTAIAAKLVFCLNKTIELDQWNNIKTKSWLYLTIEIWYLTNMSRVNIGGNTTSSINDTQKMKCALVGEWS